MWVRGGRCVGEGRGGVLVRGGRCVGEGRVCW